jgi:protein arginine kinase
VKARKPTIDTLIDSGEAILGGGASSCPVVISTRIRLARNLAGRPFPGWASAAQRAEILDACTGALGAVELLGGALVFKLDKLSQTERLVLVESHLISRELMVSKDSSGLVVDASRGCSVMINEEDHLRIQMVQPGMDLEGLWKRVDAVDTAIEEKLDYAFSSQLGYLTACPTNLGTGMRASAMMHLPGLCLAGHMEQVIRMVNQLGMAVRGHFGEGTEATGSIFQISNQQTLGEDEPTIIRRLGNVLSAVIEQEHNARFMLLEEKGDKFLDKIGRARGILQNGHLLSSEEAMDHLSLIRLAVDMGMLPAEWRARADRLLIATQPGHMQRRVGSDMEPTQRDALRAKIMREEFALMPTLTHISGAMSANS